VERIEMTPAVRAAVAFVIALSALYLIVVSILGASFSWTGAVLVSLFIGTVAYQYKPRAERRPDVRFKVAVVRGVSQSMAVVGWPMLRRNEPLDIGLLIFMSIVMTVIWWVLARDTAGRESSHTISS
jgi:hypothetical protein